MHKSFFNTLSRPNQYYIVTGYFGKKTIENAKSQ